MPKLPANGYPTEHPFNKDSFRYVLAEPDPHAPYKQEFDDCQDLAGKPIPGWFFRKLMPNSVLLALHDRAPQLKISEDRLSVSGDRGYCMVRATHGANYGTYYYEVKIVEMPEGSAVRLGWSQELGNLQGPAGYDKFSYSWRSRKGTAFHDSRGKHFADSGYGQGDVVGFLIHLPSDVECETGVNHKNWLPPTYKDKPLVKFKSYLYFELKDEVNKVSKSLRPLLGSRIDCYKNGKLIGTAFRDIYAGSYFPVASLYKNASVKFDFSPNMDHLPPDVKPMSALSSENDIAQSLSDALHFATRLESLKASDLLAGNFPL